METRKGLSWRQWATALLVTAALAAAVLLLMTRLTDGPGRTEAPPAADRAAVEFEAAPPEESPEESDAPEAVSEAAPPEESDAPEAVSEAAPPEESDAPEAVSEAAPPEESDAPEAVSEAAPPEESDAPEAVSEAAPPEESDAPEAVSEAAPPEESDAPEAVSEAAPPEESDAPEAVSEAAPPEESDAPEAVSEAAPPEESDAPEAVSEAAPPEESEAPEAVSEVAPPEESEAPRSPDASVAEAVFRERLDERSAALEKALEEMDARGADTGPETLTARMAAALVDSQAAEERAREAASDLGEAGDLSEAGESAPGEPLRAALAEDEARQAAAADALDGEFRALRGQVAARQPSPSPGHAAATRVGRVVVEHRSPDAMPLEEATQILGAVREGEAVFIRSLRWNGQAKETRDLWIAMGATYALLPPRGSYEPVYRVPGELDGGAAPVAVDQDEFFAGFSNRYTVLSSGDDADEVRRIEARLLRRCGACAGYRLTLVWNRETLALILSEARAFAREVGLALPRDVKTVEWLALPGSGPGRARVDVMRLVGRDGSIHAR